MIKEVNRNGWLWLLNYSATENLKEIQAEQKKTNSEVGKYLFFSDEKKLLIDLAKNILEKYDLFNAKVPSYDTPRQSENGGFGFVLCVYDTSPKLKHELKQYGNNKPRVFRLQEDRAIINHLGFNNYGIDYAISKLKDLKSNS